MQILEATELGGVRSAVWLFRHPVTPLRFELYPMVHAGEASFFRAVEAMNDLPEADEILAVDPDDPIDNLIVDQRDRRLLDALYEVHAQRAAEPIQVGVLDGAAHMRAVIHKLWALGYRPVEGTWLTVFMVND